MYTRLLVVCLLLTVQNVLAKQMNGLFVAEVTAASQSREDRNFALREAFVIVLNRVAAGNAVMLDSAVRNALNNAASYVDQYQYMLASDSEDKESPRILRVVFSEEAVMELMRSGGLAIWGKRRDEVLMWVVIEQRGKQVLFDVEQNEELNEALQAAARLKGIPVLLPLMDLEERQRISAGDIGSAEVEKLLVVSKRYGVTTMLSGKVVKQRSCWRSEWVLHFNNKVERWDVPCENLSANLETAFQGVYDRLSVFYAEKL